MAVVITFASVWFHFQMAAVALAAAVITCVQYCPDRKAGKVLLFWDIPDHRLRNHAASGT